MILTDTGEGRVNGYLFVLERSLTTFLPRDVVRDAVKEISSHLRERIAAADSAPSERVVLERILTDLGSPLRVAQAYSSERIVDEAVTSGRVGAVARAVAHMAVTTVTGFALGLVALVGYTSAFAFLLLAALKPIFPANVGVQTIHGWPVGIGARFPAPLDPVLGGYWIIPLCIACGLGIFVGTHRGARAFLGWWRRRRVSSPIQESF
jgi:uncharacterized membrane protein